MVKNNVGAKSKIIRNEGLHINFKVGLGYRKLKAHLQQENIGYHTCSMEKTDLRVVVRGVLPSCESDDIMEVLIYQGIDVNRVDRLTSP